METFLTKAGKKVFAKNLEKYTPEDPLYEYYTDKKGRQKRRKRELPPGLSNRDARILRTVKKRAHRLDKGLSLLGMRVGYSFFLGLIPIVGDAADLILGYLLVVRPARGADLPPWLLRRMLLNCALSTGVGLVPIAGDVAAAAFKANARNAALLEELLRIRGAEFLKMHGPDGVHEEDAARHGWFGGRAKKGAKGDARQGAKRGEGDARQGAKRGEGEKAALPPADVAQVKPGAGMGAAEMREATAAGQDSQQSGSSGFHFFGRKKSTPPATPGVNPPGAQGRFVENVNSEAA